MAAQIEGHQIGGWGEKFGRPTKMAAHLLPLLEIKFLRPQNKYEDRSSFSHPAGVALRDNKIKRGTQTLSPSLE